MNPHQNSLSNPRNTNPNSQSSNTQFSYPFPHPSYPYVQNPNIDYPQPPNSQSSNTQFSYTFPHPSYLYPNIDNSQPTNIDNSQPPLIKRGVVAIKKRWQRINEGAQRYESCYEQAERRAGSGSNMDNIIEAAHEIRWQMTFI